MTNYDVFLVNVCILCILSLSSYAPEGVFAQGAKQARTATGRIPKIASFTRLIFVTKACTGLSSLMTTNAGNETSTNPKANCKHRSY
uniref:Secreted protein n=1 Tax=Oreochromis niloticus TaxID=8128 RepID=A0A669B323_ORENI